MLLAQKDASLHVVLLAQKDASLHVVLLAQDTSLSLTTILVLHSIGTQTLEGTSDEGEMFMICDCAWRGHQFLEQWGCLCWGWRIELYKEYYMYHCIVNGFVAKLNHWFNLNGIIVVSDTYRWFISLFQQSQQDKKHGHDKYAFRRSALRYT